jgi:hypothetical protein
MSRKRRRSRNRSSSPKLPRAAQVIGFTEQEEEFFRAGQALAEQPVDDASDDASQASWLRRLWSRVAA